MTRTTITLLAALALSACGTDRSPTPNVADPVEGAEAVAPAAPSPDPSPVDNARDDAIARAEAFVRAQGYTDAPPTVSGDAIVREGIEGSLEDRRGMLEPTAVGAGRAEDGTWSVTFRYADPELAGRGRTLILAPDGTPRFVHQDRLLEPAE